MKKCHPDEIGNALMLEVTLGNVPVLLVATYVTNADSPDFWRDLIHQSDNLGYDNILIFGDLNFTFSQELDTYNYKSAPSPRIRKLMQKLVDDEELCDAFRTLHPTQKTYSWVQFDRGNRQKTKMSRLDMGLATPCLMNNIVEVKHLPAFNNNLDHGTMIITIDFDQFKPGKGNFCTPPHIHTDPLYVERINAAIDNTLKVHLDPTINHDDIQNMRPEDLSMLASSAKPGVLFETILSICKINSQKFVAKRNAHLKKEKIDLDSEVFIWNRAF